MNLKLDDNYFPGTIRNQTHMLNMITRLLLFFKTNIFNSMKTESVWNIYTFQHILLKELWIDFRSIKLLLKRFIVFLNDNEYTQYNE